MPIARLESTDPYLNLAVEERALTEPNRANEPMLLLWTSDPAVVIGRHQNPWQECRPRRLENADIVLARRISGGGAVYHDHGNLNISFIAPSDIYDQTRQFDTIVRALASLGITAEHTNRNDIVVSHNERRLKVSGSAFRHTRGRSLHHATLLVSADLDALRASLTPTFTEISSAAIQSVRSSVCNLADICLGLSVDEVSAAVATSFASEFHSEFPPTHELPAALQQWSLDADLARRCSELARWEWIYGRTPPSRFALATCPVSGRSLWPSAKQLSPMLPLAGLPVGPRIPGCPACLSAGDSIPARFATWSAVLMTMPCARRYSSLRRR